MTNTYFKLDDWVKIKNHQKQKFQFSWKGPYIVHGYGYFPTYWLRGPNGKFLKSLVNQANMAPWTARIEDNEEFFYWFNKEEDYRVDNEEEYSDQDGSEAFLEEENDIASLDCLGLELEDCVGTKLVDGLGQRQGYLFVPWIQ